MKKNILLIAALFTLAANINATPVDANTARQVATRFWNAHRPADAKAADMVTERAFPQYSHLHIFDVDGTGFVIVAGDNCARPVLAYSFDDIFPEQINPELRYWLNGYETLIAEAANMGYKADASIVSQWDNLTSGEISATPKSLTAIPTMLTTRWDQGDPFNIYCPYDSIYHTRTVVGCVATAMAQIMKYWNYPSFGQGSRTYNYSYFGDLSADFQSTTYLWQFMTDFLDVMSLDFQKDAIATLSYHCGVAVEMMYGVSAVGGSGAYSSCGDWTNACATSAFIDHFKYDQDLFHLSRYNISDSAWTALIDTNLALGQPLYYSGRDSTGGHAFVLDGSDSEGRYHFNMGWNGYGNGFYTVNNIAPGSGGAGGNATYTFNWDQGAIFGIKPGMVEVFDTVDYYDSVCNDSRFVDFREYHLLAANMDTLLRHLDTIFNYHLKIISKKKVYFDYDVPNVQTEMVFYCPATGITLPECTYTKENCIFLGWSRNRQDDSTIHQPGEVLFFNTNPTFHAIWNDTTYVPPIDTDTTLSIDNAQLSTLIIYPNPTTGDITLSIPNSQLSTLNSQLSIIDAMGRTVLQKELLNTMGGEVKISLQELPNGIYTVQFKSGNTILKQRVIKQ